MQLNEVPRMRCAPIPPEVSDYIVMSVLKNEELLIRGCKTREVSSNHTRKRAWENIASKIRKRYNVVLTALQIQNHFGNRKKRVLTSGNIYERRYQAPCGDGNLGAVRLYSKSHEVDAQLYRLFAENLPQQNTAPPNYDFRSQRSSISFDAYTMESRSNGMDMNLDVSDDDYHPLYEPPATTNASVKNERTAPPSFEREFPPSGSACSGDNYDHSVREVDTPDVSEAEILRLRMERLKSEKRMFDKWTELAAAQIKTFESMISMQKEILQQVTEVVKGTAPARQPQKAPSNRRDRGQAQCQEIFGFEIF